MSGCINEISLAVAKYVNTKPADVCWAINCALLLDFSPLNRFGIHIKDGFDKDHILSSIYAQSKDAIKEYRIKPTNPHEVLGKKIDKEIDRTILQRAEDQVNKRNPVNIPPSRTNGDEMQDKWDYVNKQRNPGKIKKLEHLKLDTIPDSIQDLEMDTELLNGKISEIIECVNQIIEEIK